MKITVIGAAGRLGRRVAPPGAATRSPARPATPQRIAKPGLLSRIAAGEGRDRDVVSGSVAGADAVVITAAGGTRHDPHQAADVTRRVTTAMRDHGVHRLVITSAYPHRRHPPAARHVGPAEGARHPLRRHRPSRAHHHRQRARLAVSRR